MRFLAVALCSALMATSAPVLAQAAPLDIPSGEYALDKTHASVTWQMMHFGLAKYTARFTNFDSSVQLDAKDPTKSSVTVTIDPNSVRTDFPYADKVDFDKEIASKFLQSEKFPTITFKSTNLVATGAKTGKLTGDLTFLGVTKPVTLDATLNAGIVHPMSKKPVFGVSARGSFKRSDFGMDFMQGPLGDQIDLIIELEYGAK